MSEEKRDSRQEHRRRNLAGNILVITAFVAVLLLSLVNFILMPQLDRRLESAVRREFALSEDSVVRIHRGMLGRTMRGYLPRFTVESERAVIDGIPVEDLYFEAHGIDFNMRGILRGEKAELTALDFATISIRVAEAHLQERLHPLIEAEGLLQPQLTIEEDGVKLVARKKNKLLGKVKLGAKGRFVADGSPNVTFELGELELGPVSIGVSGLGLDFDQALPVIDMGGFAGDINVDTVSTSPGYLIVGAHTGTPPD